MLVPVHFHVMEPMHDIFGRCSCWLPLRTLHLHKLYPLTPSPPCSWTFVAVKWKSMERYPQFNDMEVTRISSNAFVWIFIKLWLATCTSLGLSLQITVQTLRCPNCVSLRVPHSSISVRLIFIKKIISQCTNHQSMHKSSVNAQIISHSYNVNAHNLARF